MTDHITLPRAVVDGALACLVEECIGDVFYAETVAALRAALAEQEPVADKVKAQAFDALSRMSSFRPMKDGRHPRVVLHAFIRLASPPARQPLTTDQIVKLWNESIANGAVLGLSDTVLFARAVEHAHGIKDAK